MERLNIVYALRWKDWDKQTKKNKIVFNQWQEQGQGNLFLWWPLEISSVCLFNRVSGSAQMIETFSDIHRSLRFQPH